jgi:hypothetical protein
VSVIHGWDLSSGRAVPLHSDSRSREIPLLVCVDPWVATDEGEGGVPLIPFTPSSGQILVDVWGFDLRTVLVVQAYYRRSPWHAERRAQGKYDPTNILLNVPGEQIEASITDRPITPDSDGVERVVGDVDSGLWRNGGVIPDGIELHTGIDGVRLVVDYDVTLVQTDFVTLPCWDLVLKLTVKPHERLGCGPLVQDIAARYLVNANKEPPKLYPDWEPIE